MANLSKWQPFWGQSLFPELARFDELLRAPDFKRFVGPGGEQTGWAPHVDVHETPEAYQIKAEVPGVAPEEIKVTLHGDTLTISGEKRQEERREEDNRHIVERSYGSFQRSFTFPATVNEDSVRAESKNGVLEITVNKAREAQPRQIKVTNK